MNNDLLYLSHIAECIQYIEHYTYEGRTKFEQSTLIQHAVIRNLEVIGEASKRLSTHIRQNRPEIPWRQIAGMRDVLIHDYMGVDLNEVWNVVEHELPLLKHTVTTLLQTAQESTNE